jgi:hypothetical protein
MKNSNVPKGNTISNKVKIDLDVFGLVVLNRVRGHVDRTDVAAEDNCSTGHIERQGRGSDEARPSLS